jgi:hypothetical protein
MLYISIWGGNGTISSPNGQSIEKNQKIGGEDK